MDACLHGQRWVVYELKSAPSFETNVLQIVIILQSKKTDRGVHPPNPMVDIAYGTLLFLRNL